MGPTVGWHTEQFSEPMRSTVHMAAFAGRLLKGPIAGRVLDVACGAGANVVHLRERLGGTWSGLDIDGDLVGHAQASGLDVVRGDLHALDSQYPRGVFSASFSLMTLSWLDDYEQAVEQMLAVTDGWVFASSLFAETEFDAFVKVRDRSEPVATRAEYNYNVYSLPRFEAFCKAQPGVTEVVSEPFEIDIDLERPRHGMGSWTERTADGRRITFSGPVWMPWWFVAIRKSAPRR